MSADERTRSRQPSGRGRSLLRWLPFVVVAIEIALVGSGAVSLGNGLLAVVAIEVLLGVVLVSETAVLARTFRAARRDGTDRGAAAESALRAALPPLAARLLVMEARTFASLARWIVRRRRTPAQAQAVTYGRQMRPLLLALLPVSIVEMVVIELLVPWTLVRVVLLVASAYFCFWLVGLVASMWTRPHWVAPGRLTLNCMTFATLNVPLTNVANVRGVRISGMKHSVEVGDGTVTVSIMGSANVEVELDSPVWVTGGRQCSIHRVRFYADRPQDAIRAIEAVQ